MTYSAEVLADSPTVYLKLDEVSGTSFADSSGNGNTATGTSTTPNAASLLPGDSGKAVTFDGSSASIAVPSVSFTGDWSFEAWIKLTGSGNTNYKTLINLGGSGDKKVYLLIDPSDHLYRWSGSDSAYVITRDVVHHVVYTYNDTTHDEKFYVDGTLRHTTANGGPFTTQSGGPSLGAAGSDHRFQGILDEVAIYLSEISAARVSAHYTAGSTTTTQTISPSAIASTSTVGSPTVSPGGVTISPTGIDSSGLVGSPTIFSSLQTISPTGIGSSSSVGSPIVTGGTGEVRRGSVPAGQGEGRPQIVEWQAEEQAVGGWMGMTARTSEAALRANPRLMEEGAGWTVYSRETADVLFHGRQKTPGFNGGAVDLAADGPGRYLLTEADDLMYADFGVANWVSQDSDPHNYPTNGHIAASVDGSIFRFKPDASHTFGGGEQSGMVYQAFAQRLRRVMFTIGKDDSHSAWEILLQGANAERDGFGGSTDVLSTWNLGSTPDGTNVDFALPAGYDTVLLKVRSVGGGTYSDPPRFKLSGMKVYGIAHDDDFTCSDVVRDLCARMDVSDELVKECAIPALPAHFVGTYGDVLNVMSLITGWHGFLFREGRRNFLDFGPNERKWYATDPEIVRDLLQQPLFNRVLIEHRWESGIATGVVEARADPDPLDRTITAPVMKLDRPDSRRRATLIAQRLANDLAKPRWAGSIVTDRLRDSSGTPVPAGLARAGDQIFVPGHGWLDVDSATRNDSPLVTFTFAETSQLLNRYNERRTPTLT